MIEVTAIRINDDINKKLFNELTKFISPEKQKRIQSFYNYKDAQRCLLGEILVRNDLLKKGWKNTNIIVNRTPYGKPYIKNAKNFCFNISHSGDWITYVNDKENVGIDVQQINREINAQIITRFFSQEELMDIWNKKDSNRLSYIYDLWTLKESYIKAEGKGLYIPLSSFSIRYQKNTFLLTTKRSQNYFFKKYYIDRAHRMSVCARKNNFSDKLIVTTAKELCDEFIKKVR